MWDIEQLYNDCYTLYERNEADWETNGKIEKILYEVDAIYSHAQNEIYGKFLEIKKILSDNQLQKWNQLSS